MRLKCNEAIKHLPDDRGALLLPVLILLLALSLVAAAVLELSVLEHRLTAYEVERQQLLYGADSGMELARGLLAGGLAVTEDPQEYVFSPDGTLDVRVSLRRLPAANDAEGAEDAPGNIACTSTASLRSVSGRTVSGAVYCELCPAPDGHAAIVFYRFVTGEAPV